MIPQIGDVVEITVHGTVSATDALSRFVTLDGLGSVPIPGGSVRILKRAAYPDGTVAISQNEPSQPAVKRDGNWDSGPWRSLTDDIIRRSPFWTVVHEPPA